MCVKVPHLCENLLSAVDQPLKVARDKAVGKDYLLCDYNRDGDSYRYGIWSIGHMHTKVDTSLLISSLFTCLIFLYFSGIYIDLGFIVAS